MTDRRRTKRWGARLLAACMLLGTTALTGCYHHYRHHDRHGGYYGYDHNDDDRDRRRERRHHRRHGRDRRH